MNQYLIKQLADQLTTPDSNMQAVVLADDPKTKVVLFSFAPGSGLTEHVAPFDATIQIVSGTATLTVGDQKIENKAGTWIKMNPKTPHSIQAVTSVVMLLALAK